MNELPPPQQVNEAATAKAAAVILYRMGLTPIRVTGKKPVATAWQKTVYANEQEVEKEFESWAGKREVVEPSVENGKTVYKKVMRDCNVGVITNGLIMLGPNTQEAIDALRAEFPAYDETLCRMANNPYPCALLKRTDVNEPFWSGQKIMTNEKSPKTMADIWADRNQFVAWGVHPSGARNRFINNSSILPITTTDTKDLMYRVIKRMGDGYRLKTEDREEHERQEFDAADSIFTRVKRAVRIKTLLGTRENRILCPLHQQTSTNPSAVIYEDSDGDHVYCHSSGCYADVVKLNAHVKSISQIESARQLAQEYNVNLDGLPRYDKTEGHREEQNEETLIEGIRDYINSCLNAKKQPDRMELVSRVAHYLTEKENMVTLDDTHEIYVYRKDKGIYTPSGENGILVFTQQICDRGGFTKYASAAVCTETVEMIKRLTLRSREQVEPPLNLIALNNGILDTKTYFFTPFTPEHFFMSKLAVNYDPSATCPQFDAFLTSVAPNYKQIVYEIAGWLPQRQNQQQKGVVLHGTGANGKSTLIFALEAMLGTDNTTSVSMQELEIDRFATANLFNKYANLVPDMSGEDLKATSKFKALVGGDQVRAQNKNGNPFFFKNYAKFLISCNKLPRTPDDTRGFFRRLIVLPFEANFEGKEDRTITARISTPSELSGLLNAGIKAFREVQASGRFTYDQNSDQVRALYLRLSDSASAFSEDQIVIDEESEMPKQTLWFAYLKFCSEQHLVKCSEKKFWTVLPEKYMIVFTKRKIDEDRAWFVKGIKLKNESVCQKKAENEPDFDGCVAGSVESTMSGMSGIFPIAVGISEKEKSEKTGVIGKKPDMGDIPDAKTVFDQFEEQNDEQNDEKLENEV